MSFDLSAVEFHYYLNLYIIIGYVEETLTLKNQSVKRFKKCAGEKSLNISHGSFIFLFNTHNKLV